MSRSTRTITAGIAAFAALAPAAVAMPQDGPIQSTRLAGMTTAQRQDLRSPDARDAAAATTSHLRRDGNAAVSYVPPTTRIVHVDSSGGFDVTDAAIGAGGAFAALVLVAGSGVVLRRRTTRQSVAA